MLTDAESDRSRRKSAHFQDIETAVPVDEVHHAPRIDLDINGLTVFLARVPAGADIQQAPADPHLGLDHFGLRVDNLDAAYAELKRRGADFAVEPKIIRPGVKIAFVRGPDNVRIELLERS